MKKFFKWVGILVGGFFALVIVAAFFVEPKTDGSSSASTASTATPEASVVAVSASQLFKDYQDNEVAADQKYKDKRLAVTGTVQSIDKDAFNNIVVRLRTPNEFMAAMASLDDKHEQLAASLRKGEKVVWACSGGGIIVGSPVLRKCSPRPI